MSYDFYIHADTGGPERATVEEIGNCTSNVSQMWTLALRATSGDPDHPSIGTRWGYDKSPRCADVLVALRPALHWLRNHKAEMKPLEPSNGWGSYEGALRTLERVVDACERHPSGWLYISC